MVSRQCYVVFIASATNILLYYYYVVATCIFNLSLYKSCHFQIIREIGFTRHYTNTDLSKISIPFLSCQKTSEHKHSWFLNPHSHLHYPPKNDLHKNETFFQNPCPFEYHTFIISKENFNIAWFVSKKVSMKWILPSKNALPWKINFPNLLSVQFCTLILRCDMCTNLLWVCVHTTKTVGIYMAHKQQNPYILYPSLEALFFKKGSYLNFA